MKKIALFLTLIMFAVACHKPMDKKAELQQLTKEHDVIAEKIAKLQKEIAGSDTSAGSKMKIKNIATTIVKPTNFNHYIEIQGKVDGDEIASVFPKGAGGIVTRILVKEGQMVRKGQILAELDAEVTKKSLTALKDQLTFATTVYNKQKNLWDQKLGSEIQYLTAKNTKESLENNVKTLEEQLDMSKLVSPIDGSVEDIPIKVGQMVSPAAPALRVVNFKEVKVVAELAEAYASKVKSGDEVILFFPDLNKEVKTKITFSSKFINPTIAFKANMIAVVKINDYSATNVISAPINCIQNSSDGQYVFMIRKEGNNEVAHRQTITTGLIYNGLAEIKTGLKLGDQIVTLGYQDLNEGQYVKF